MANIGQQGNAAALYSTLAGRISSITRNARLSEDTNEYMLQGDLISRAQQTEYSVICSGHVVRTSEPDVDSWAALGSSGTIYSAERHLCRSVVFRRTLRCIGRRQSLRTRNTCGSTDKPGVVRKRNFSIRHKVRQLRAEHWRHLTVQTSKASTATPDAQTQRVRVSPTG